MNILAIDLGTKTGWARRGIHDEVFAGTWELPAKKKGQNCCAIDPRLVLFRNELFKAVAGWKDVAFVYEDVKFVRSQAQAHLWAGFRAVLWLFAHDHNIPTFCCPVQTLKKFATGSGAADKEAMALAYFEKIGAVGLPPSPYFDSVPATKLDDNAIDAWHLLHWAEATLTIPKKSSP